jgi:hypothetical protein
VGREWLWLTQLVGGGADPGEGSRHSALQKAKFGIAPQSNHILGADMMQLITTIRVWCRKLHICTALILAMQAPLGETDGVEHYSGIVL